MRARELLLVIAGLVALAVGCRGKVAPPRAPEPVAREVPVELAWPDAAPGP